MKHIPDARQLTAACLNRSAVAIASMILATLVQRHSAATRVLHHACPRVTRRCWVVTLNQILGRVFFN
ncbi:MAG: hypothetical protein KGM99_01895, partial [Burkholderiales bacterium]|nr:hypothetical protein [Burkholderiales bacterium]